MKDDYELVIVGAGPAGISAALRAAAHDREQHRDSPSYLLLEASAEPAKTISDFQYGKHVMSEPAYLDLRSDAAFSAGRREDVLDRWKQALTEGGVNVRYGSRLIGVASKDEGFTLQLADATTIRASKVILAIGVQGNPRQLGVPGEDAGAVQYQLVDPAEYNDQTILVVGGGDAAIENALALAEQNNVIILNRRAEFARVKPDNQVAILNAISSPHTSLQCLYDTSVVRIEAAPDAALAWNVIVATGDGEATLPADRVIARLGSIPPRALLEECGLEFPSSQSDSLPELDECYQSSVPGFYVVGALAGYPLIKQALNQGYDVVERLSGNDLDPVDQPLLEAQFVGLPYDLPVDDLVRLLRTRIPMLRQLNLLMFRELIVESRIYVSYSDTDAAADAQGVIKSLVQGGDSKRSGLVRATRLLPPGASIYESGDRALSFFTVLDGTVTLRSRQLSGGYAYLERGDFFGETSLISGQARQEQAIAGDDCVVLETPRRTMVKLMHSHPAVQAGIDWVYTARALQRHFAPSSSLRELRETVDGVKLQTYESGEEIYALGAPAESLHIVRRGAIALARPVDSRRMLVVAQARAGEVVGRMGVLGARTRDETATAAVAVETLELSKDLYHSLIARDPDQDGVIRSSAGEAMLARSVWESKTESHGLVDFLLADGLGEATNALVIDESLCVGCDQCETACAATHDGVSRLHRKEGATFGTLRVPISCRHCAQPHCMKDCPPNAIARTAAGEVVIDDSCIGCGNCVVNCPYDAIALAETEPGERGFWTEFLFGSSSHNSQNESHSVVASGEVGAASKLAVKCDACTGSSAGPACVNACPTGAAIRFSPDPVSALLEGRS